MKRFLFLLVSFVIAACSTTQYTMYRPSGSTDAPWQIDVKYSYGTGDNFKVIINDSTVIEKSALVFYVETEEKGTYRGKEIKLQIIPVSGILGAGNNNMVFVYVNNELAFKYKF